jgi:serine/threonine protein kinase
MTKIDDNCELWNEVESELNLTNDLIKVIRQKEKGRSVYIGSKQVCKVSLLLPEFTTADDYQDLCAEKLLLDELSDLKEAVNAIGLVSRNNHRALFLEKIEGVGLDCIDYSVGKCASVNLCMIVLLFKLSMRGVAHGDLVPHNIILLPDGTLKLLDFGHAFRTTRTAAFLHNFLLNKVRHPGFNRPYLVTLVRTVEFSLPQRARQYYRKLLGIGPYTKDPV